MLKLWIMSIKERGGGLNCCPLVRNRKETESSLGEDLIHHFRGDSDHDDETLMKCWPIRIIKVFPRPKLLCYWAERTEHKRKRGRTVSTIAPTCTSCDFKYSRSEGEWVVNTNSHQSSYSVFGWGHNHQFSQSLRKCRKMGNLSDIKSRRHIFAGAIWSNITAVKVLLLNFSFQDFLWSNEKHPGPDKPGAVLGRDLAVTKTIELGSRDAQIKSGHDRYFLILWRKGHRMQPLQN